jgi:Carboxypeptidase regulatory-like domain
MKKIIRSTVLSLVLTAVGAAYGAAVPALNVIVSDSSGKAAFKGTTNAKGTFATASLKPGNYAVQFNSAAAMKGTNYTIVVSAGTKKVSAAGVAGEKFAKGGVALKVDVGPGLNISGQVAAEAAGASKNGKKMVWIAPHVGSNMPGHWVEEDSAEAKEAKTAGNMSKDSLQRMQEKAVNPQGN